MKKDDKIFIDSLSDKEIVELIIERDSTVTRLFLYEKCFPLFKANYDRYYTDCDSCLEFINEIYLYLLTPRDKTGRNPLNSFGFSCSLEYWLKIVVENYCHQLYKKRKIETEKINYTDRFTDYSVTIDINSINKSDIEKVLNMMANKRYRELIRYRYIEQKTNEETAALLSMNMDNYYNKHKLAKEQFTQVLSKEGL